MSEKVSRRAILDRSLNYDPKLDDTLPDQDDIWYSSSKLFEDHVSEIHGKWDAIEDDIWGKVIVMERNRRVAKAYVRSPVVSVGGGNEGFDGLRVGLQGFDNPFRDEETRAVLSRLGGQCCRIQMDSEGFVEVTRTGRTEVSVQSALSVRRTASASQPGTLPRRRQGPGSGRLGSEGQSLLMFDMTKLKRNMADSFMYHGAASRNKRELELECVTTLSFVRQSDNILDQPCWLILINLVSLDFLRTSLAQQPVFTLRGCPAGELRTRPRLSLPHEEVRRREAGTKRGESGQESLYYGGVQARISQFVLSEANRSRRAMQDTLRYKKGLEAEGSGSESESEYSQIEAAENMNMYSDQAYDVKWR